MMHRCLSDGIAPNIQFCPFSRRPVVSGDSGRAGPTAPPSLLVSIHGREPRPGGVAEVSLPNPPFKTLYAGLTACRRRGWEGWSAMGRANTQFLQTSRTAFQR